MIKRSPKNTTITIFYRVMHFYDQNKSIVRRFRLDADGRESSEKRKLEMQIQTHALICLLCAVLKVVLFYLDGVFPSDKIGIARDFRR